MKGLFWLLEECRPPRPFAVHPDRRRQRGRPLHRPAAAPVTETMGHSPYPGCYALAKVLEEVMLEQYYVQYDLNGCCCGRRGSWRRTISSTPSASGRMSSADRAGAIGGGGTGRPYAQAGTVPMLCDAQGTPSRNFVHVEDLVSAILHAIDNPKARQQRSTSAWTSRWITGRWQSICRGRAAYPGRSADPMLLDLAGQHEGQIPARLASSLRSSASDRRGMDLPA